MIEFKIKNISYRLDFSFFLLWAMIYLLGRERLILPTFIACLIHEMGHIIVMILSKKKIKSIEFRGTGIKIIPIYDKILSWGWDMAIISSGCISNFLLSMIIISFKIAPLYDLACVSFSLGFFNLLPFRHLDGGCIVALLRDLKND